MAKIVDLNQGGKNVYPRTIGEAVAVGGKLLTDAMNGKADAGEVEQIKDVLGIGDNGGNEIEKLKGSVNNLKSGFSSNSGATSVHGETVSIDSGSTSNMIALHRTSDGAQVDIVGEHHVEINTPFLAFNDFDIFTDSKKDTMTFTNVTTGNSIVLYLGMGITSGMTRGTTTRTTSGTTGTTGF